MDVVTAFSCTLSRYSDSFPQNNFVDNYRILHSFLLLAKTFVLRMYHKHVCNMGFKTIFSRYCIKFHKQTQPLLEIKNSHETEALSDKE